MDLQDFDEFFEVGLLNTGLHDLHHLLSDELLLGGLGVAGSLHLTRSLLGEADGKHSHDVAVHGFGLYVGLNQRVPFLDHRAGVVPGDVHTMEVGVAIVSLDLVDLELQLSPGGRDLLRGVAIVEGDGDDTTLQASARLLSTVRFVHGSERHNSLVEAWSQHIVPLFSGEWMGSKT